MTEGETFQREERYIVVKRKHLANGQELLIDNCSASTVECVVVESDWPEYEMVWRMIEDRVMGRPAPDSGDRNAVLAEARREVINSPETADFMAGVPLEAAHQRERWGADHDAGKSAFDWFWLVGYLAQKAADAQVRGHNEKALHHTISTAAALANWHASISGADTRMRPGIEPPAALSTPEPVNDTPEGGTLQGPQQLDYAGEKLPVGAPRDPIEEPVPDDRDAEVSDLRMRLITADCEWQELAEKSADTIARLREAGDALAKAAAGYEQDGRVRSAIEKWQEARDATN